MPILNDQFAQALPSGEPLRLNLGSGGTLKPVTEAASVAAPEGEGYRETEHIRRYYGTTRL